LRFGEINFNYPKLRFLHMRFVFIYSMSLPDIGKCNEFSGSDPDSIQPLKLFFVIQKGLRYDSADKKPERPRFIFLTSMNWRESKFSQDLRELALRRVHRLDIMESGE
jgi:hypothetical protein